MATILTDVEASNVLRCEATDQTMLDLLPQVDAFIRRGTGRDWSTDSPIHPLAKNAARMLLVKWYENPGMIGTETGLSFGLSATLSQLEIITLQYKEFRGRYGAGAVALSGVRAGDTVNKLTGLIGVSGDQKANFETVITVDDQIQQTATGDMSANWYRVKLTPVEEL